MSRTTELEKVLINRDGMSAEEAKAEKNRLRESIFELIEDGASYDEVEDLLADEVGLEPDYLEDLLF